MKKAILKRFKQFLTIIGASMGGNTLHQIQMVVNYMKLGRWMRKNNFNATQRVFSRFEVFDSVARQVQNKQVLYLEFGVFEGKSMRYWSNALKHPESILHGFDSFEGLPEDFDVEGPYVKGTFDVEGQLPQINDERVQFFKGWFNEVLPNYQLPNYEILVIVVDADLYSSTKYVLNYFCQHIKRGTFIYFDDMSRPEHEPKAFEEFMVENDLNFRLISADYTLNNAFFEFV